MNSIDLSSKRRLRVAFVVPRAGRGVAGGAEALAQTLARELSADIDIEILTSRSISLDWKDDLPSEDRLDSARGEVTIRRFNCRVSPTVTTFGSVQNSVKDEFALVGPDLPELPAYLRKNLKKYNAVVAFGYAFYTTLIVSELSGEVPIILHPCLHDEPQSRRWFYALVLRRFDHVIVQTPEEAHYLKRLFDLDPPRLTIIAPGIELAAPDDENADAIAAAAPPYVLYVGRLDHGKNVGSLFAAFTAFHKAQFPGSVGEWRPTLKVLGKPTKDYVIEPHPGIEYLGFVSDAVKAAYLRHAICLINPSRYESLSLIVLEAWAAATPVLVNGECEVLVGQVTRAGGGLSYVDFISFCEQLRRLITDRIDARSMGESGRRFVEKNFRWTEDLRGRYVQIFEDTKVTQKSAAVAGRQDSLDLVQVRSRLAIARALAPLSFNSHTEK